MRQSLRSTRGMAVAPHALAAQSALGVLRERGNALEAMIAAAATIAVVYPHMNGLGGDGFWLVHAPGLAPGVIDASGAAAGAASIEWYRERGVEHAIPHRGPLAANTVAGTVSGWAAALRLARVLGGRLPLKRLLEDAIHYAEHGVPVTQSQALATAAKRAELSGVPGFGPSFLPDGEVPPPGGVLRQKRLADTLRRIARAGPEDFYRGELARSIAEDLQQAGSPLTVADLRRHRARLRDPLVLPHSAGDVLAPPPPSQGLSALLILGLLDQLGAQRLPAGSAEFIHLCVEATKLAFAVRDAHVADPAAMTVDCHSFLHPESLRTLAARIDLGRATPWKDATPGGDTVWMGVVDGKGRAVSFIQSLYHEFGSGLVLRNTGICWQNRGCSFPLLPAHINALAPGKKPLHTLSPAMARLNDGRTLVFGSMGGDGQPQTVSALFARMVADGRSAQEAISAPRWLLGRTWGEESSTLKLEARFPLSVAEKLGSMGHAVEIIGSWNEVMGHAGAIVRRPDGVLEGGADPRSDGVVAAY